MLIKKYVKETVNPILKIIDKNKMDLKELERDVKAWGKDQSKNVIMHDVLDIFIMIIKLIGIRNKQKSRINYEEKQQS